MEIFTPILTNHGSTKLAELTIHTHSIAMIYYTLLTEFYHYIFNYR